MDGMDPDDFEVHAAGGVVWRRGQGGEAEWAVIHRPHRDDWSMPKGKLDPGESFEQTAVREVREEIGVRCELGVELPSTSYSDDRGRAKLVRYWLMETTADHPFAPNDEVDRLDWMPASGALHALSYDRDRELLQAAVDALGSADEVRRGGERSETRSETG